MTKIACAVGEIKSLKSDELKAILDKDKAGEFFLLDVICYKPATERCIMSWEA